MTRKNDGRSEAARGAEHWQRVAGKRDDDKAKDKKPDDDKEDEDRDDELESEGPADDDEDDEEDKNKKKDKDDDRKRSLRSRSSPRIRNSAGTHLGDIRAHRRNDKRADEQRVSEAIDFERGKEHAMKIAERSGAVGLRRR